MRSVALIRIVIGLLRVVVGAFTIFVLLYTSGLSINGGDANPFDYFGYFTNQANLFMGIVLVATGVLTLARREPPNWLNVLRGAASSYVIVVAVIYNVLVPGTGSAPVWVSTVLHVIVPAFAVLDWVLVNDRRPLPWRRLWMLLPYPLVWLTVVLARGATDGWVPYGFLLPENGPVSLTLHIIALIGAVLIAGVLIWWASRLSVFTLESSVGRMDPFEVVVRGELFRISERRQPSGAMSYDFAWLNGPADGTYGFTVGGAAAAPAHLVAEARGFVEAFYAPGGIGETDFPGHAPQTTDPY